MSIDTEFLSIINHSLHDTESVSSRDFRILKSLARSISSPVYITENQSRLLIKLIQENIEYFKSLNPQIEQLINEPVWSRPFRVADKTRKLYIGTVNDEPVLHIEYAFSNALRKHIIDIGKNLDNFAQALASNKLYYAALTEKNIVELVEKLSPLKFEIDYTIRDYYKIITSWSRQEICDRYKINTITESSFKEKLSLDLGLDNPLSDNIIADRSIRYQFFFEKNKDPTSLTESIAYRNNKRIWINDADYRLHEVINSLIELKRLPILFVFDLAKCYNQLLEVHEALINCNIRSGVGIYFRVNGNTQNGKFNTFIADHQYNAHLDKHISIVGIPNGKVPKFFLKDNWQPMSVISLDNSLKNNKTAVFLNCCDLIISYSSSRPLIEARLPWV